MKLKIIFCEPPGKHIQTSEDEKIIIIQSPYKIIQAELGDTREYEKSDESKMPEDFTYEQYCQEMRKLIHTTIAKSNISDYVYNQIIIEGFSQPPNFQAICSEIEKTPIFFVSRSKILFENCSFGGKQYTDATTRLIHSFQNRHFKQFHERLAFEIVIDDQDKQYLSKHDKARLAMLKGVIAYQNSNQDIFLKPFRDDSLIGEKGSKKSLLMSRLKLPTFFYQNNIGTIHGQTTAEIVLKNFFSQEAQQQSDFTCGPATVKMVADYFSAMQTQNFCNSPVANQKVWQTIKQAPEMILAQQISTTEAEGSDIPDIRTGLMQMGITVFDDNGLSDKEHNYDILNAHKCLLWDKMRQILKLGIPVILNMQDKGGCGHYEVVIGIETSPNEEYIILAEPGTALVGALEFEHIPKDIFIDRWKNMSGEFHGRIMILSPNEASAQVIDSILAGIPHYKNGKEQNDSFVVSSPKL
ncbi:papain-like cysteine protease family protein [Legionella gresilensis]|uniref:papain-like cysteine protease family protein n=1 Tax=Legionella gresilensis TaxID=91823 RepID=UPI0010413257|nr:papain-like cysteine protease family protein [Legionella gresilensis]